jgi:hypothetical protein
MASVPLPRESRARSRLVVFIALVAIAFVSRAGYGLATGRMHADASTLRFDDERWYWKIAESLHEGDGLVGEFGHRAERMPLYPAFLSLFAGYGDGVALARGAQWLLGALAAGLTYLFARSVCRPPYAVLAGLGVACDPALVGCASLLLTETLFVTALVALWWVAWPLRERAAQSLWRWFAVAGLGAVSVYLRESAIAYVALLTMFLVIVRRDVRSLLGTAIIIAIVVGALLPWAYRNKSVIGEWCWLTTRGGISLYDGVRPGAIGASDLGDVKNLPEVRKLDEAAWNHYFERRAWEAIQNEPGRVLALVPVKLARTWSPILNAQEYQSGVIRAVFALWYIPLYAAALVGIWARRREISVWIGLMIPALCVSILHSLYVGSVRYRLAALPMLMILGAAGAAWLISRLRRRPTPAGEAP